MADSIFNRIINRVRKPSISPSEINDLVEKRVNEEISKAKAGDVIRFSPRLIASTAGASEKPYPLGVDFQTLREFADFYPIARSCIEFRKSQITHLDWTVGPAEITDETVQDKKNIENSKELKDFFKYPTGRKDSSFTNWLKQILEDLLVIDAVAIYRRRNRKNDILGYLPIDGSTIQLILNPDGTTPEPPEDAYVQKVRGQEKGKLTTDDLIYAMMTPRTYNAYGLAPLETLIITVTTALKLQAYNIGILTEGNVPEGFVTLPREIASSRDQLKEWQDAWDAMLAGDPRFQRKLKFLPEGMKFQATKTSSDMSFERFEKWLLQCTCSVFGLHPSAIGFNFDINRATAQTTWEAGRERGLFPTALFLKEIFDRMIQDDMQHPELQFIWTNINPTNTIEEASSVTKLINSGLMAIDEWRLGEGLKPIGVKDPLIMTPVGPMFVKDLVAQSAAGQQPVAPYKPTGESKNPQQNKLPIPSIARTSNMDDLRKWKKVAIKDFKERKPIREFRSEVIDERIQQIIRTGLQRAKSKEAIFKTFEPFLKSEISNSKLLLNLYDDINTIISKTGKSQGASDLSA